MTAEAFQVVHSLDFKAHKNGELCTLCLSMTSLASAAVGQVFVFSPDISAVPFVVLQPRPLISVESIRPTARDPPTAS